MYRPVFETEMRERRYRVAKPVIETSEREERYTVQKPVWDTFSSRRQLRRRENSLRNPAARAALHGAKARVGDAGARRSLHRATPRVRNRRARGTVHRTAARHDATRTSRSIRAAGSISRSASPGPVRNRLTWQPSACVVDPATGASTYQRGGLVWMPTQMPGRLTMQRIWQPNIVTQQIPQTTMVARVETHKVPVQTCRYEDSWSCKRCRCRSAAWSRKSGCARFRSPSASKWSSTSSRRCRCKVCRMVSTK